MSAGPTSEADRIRARRCWRTLEPVHGIVYFTPHAKAVYDEIGVHGRTGYFLSRSAAMGRVRTATVVATFYNFHPGLVARAMEGVPDGLDLADVLDARLRVVDLALRDGLGDAVESDAMARAAELASRAAVDLEPLCAGRPLGAAHAALAPPEEPHLRLWWAVTALREHRGDGHIAALVDAELSGLEALVLHAATGEVSADVLKATRAWSDGAWDRAVAGLADRGLVHADGSFTDDGAALRERIEERTDRLAAPPWRRLSDDDADELRSLVRPWSKALFADLSPG